jgi:hypothetical protein
MYTETGSRCTQPDRRFRKHCHTRGYVNTTHRVSGAHNQTAGLVYINTQRAGVHNHTGVLVYTATQGAA